MLLFDMGRARSLTTPEEACCLLKLSSKDGLRESFVTTDFDQVLKHYEQFIADILLWTRLSAWKMVQKKPQSRTKSFSTSLINTIRYARVKSGFATSGLKTEPATRRICRMFEKGYSKLTSSMITNREN